MNDVTEKSNQGEQQSESDILSVIENRLARIGVTSRGQKLRLATAESCTGGWISKMMTDLPGSSRWFEAGLVVYSNEAKTRLLQVPSIMLTQHGAVSEAVARAMVSGCLSVTAADLAVAVTGIAGPSGGSPEKPVGTVWIGWQLSGQGSVAECFHFSGDRNMVRLKSVLEAANGILRLIDTESE